MNILDEINALLETERAKHPLSQFLIGLGNNVCVQVANALAAQDDCDMLGILALLSQADGIELFGQACKFSPLLDEDDVVVTVRKVQFLPPVPA